VLQWEAKKLCRRGPHRRLCPLRQYGGMRPPPRNMHSASPGRKRKAAGQAGPHRPKRAPCSRPWAGARQRGGRISHKLFYFTERPHVGTAKRAAQAPQPGNKDVRHAQAAGLAARLYNAPGKLPPEREKAPSRTPHWQRMAAQACTAGGKLKRAVFAACEPHEDVPAREGNEAVQPCPAHAGAGAPQPGSKDVRHAQAAGLAARLYNAPGKHPPERERTPPGQTHRGMAKRTVAGQRAALRPFLLKEAPPLLQARAV